VPDVYGQIWQINLQFAQFWPIRTEHVDKGNEDKIVKHGLTTFKDRIKLHLTPCAGKLLTVNQTVSKLIKGGVP